MNQPKIQPRPVTFDQWRFDVDVYAESGEVGQGDQQSQVAAGWVPRGGIVLRNVYHGGFRLAYDLGVAGIWVFPSAAARASGYQPVQLVLGPPDFSQADVSWKIMKPGQPFDVVRTVTEAAVYTGLSAVNNMAVFNNSAKGELVVRWMSNKPLFGKDSGYLFVTQRFILMDYDAEPAHEPGGVLKATRLHPVTEILYEHAQAGQVESFRIDYRIYANLDSFWYRRLHQEAGPWMIPGGVPMPVIKEGRETEPNGGKLDNSAGLFRDHDSLLHDVVSLLVSSKFGPTIIPKSLTVADRVFEAAEKPLKYEVVADGLNPALGRKVWDNVHWWGVNAAKQSVTPSAPGAFHALHMHWRWSKAFQDGAWWIGGSAGEAQFKGKGNGGILVDPRIDKQKLRVAIVVNDGLPDDVSAHSSEVFEDFFMNRKRTQAPTDLPAPLAPPTSIAQGGDLVLYYSAEVPALNRSSIPEYNARKILNGDVFVHGVFFAHEPELSLLKAGAREPVYSQPSEADVPHAWVRNPQVDK